MFRRNEMRTRSRSAWLATALIMLFLSCGGGSSSGGGGPVVPPTPTGVNAAPGNAQVVLTWNASSGATSYNVKRSTTSGAEVTIATSATASYTDTAVTNGTPYYYEVSAVNSAGESANSGEVTATPVAPPTAPTGLTATPGNAQVALAWTASTGAASYHVKRGTTSGGESTTPIATATTNSYNDTTVTNGTPYYYVVSAVNAGGESGNSNEATATPAAITNVHVAVDVLSNRHAISPYVYGGAFPKDAPTITDSGLSVVRWGGNATSTYNWKLGTDNADNDWYFEDFGFGALNNSADSDSIQFIKDVKAAGGNPLMTMVMLQWVAQTAETSGQQGGANNYHWVFSVSRDGACASSAHVDKYNTDAGINLNSDCATTMVASTAQLNRAYYPLLDGPPQPGDPANSVYRNQWAQAMATAFGSTSSCPIPYFPSLTSCHFYDMDNEIDIWGGTHVDIHPNPAGYDELRNIYLTEARNLKGWDTAAVRLGPVSCCWWFYWNGANGSDKGAHAGVDFLPWWLNEVYWQDQIAGSPSLDVFDIHAYPDGPDTSNFTQAQKQALAARIYRDYWDPTYVSESGTINQQATTQIQPNKTIAFRIPRMRAILNMIYPGVPLAFTEWSAEFAGGADFSTALGDADAYGILGRERVSLATRWTAPDPANPNYQALKLFTRYDGTHGFAPISVSATNDGDPNLFSSYAAVSADGKTMTLLFLDKDPANTAQTQFALNGFTPSQVTTYTLSQANPSSIVASGPQAWSASMSFAPYTATLLVISGTTANVPPSEWDLNPDTVMVPAGGTVTLSPKIVSGSTNVTLGTPQSDPGITVAITQGTITPTQDGTITVTAGNTPGFYHYSVSSTDLQQQGGWIVVGNPPATFPTKTGDGQSGTKGTPLANALTVTLNAGTSGGTATGASVLFTTDGGTLSNGTTSGAKVVAITNSSGVASVTLTLPGTAGTVHVTAEGQYGLGHPTATFTETAN